MTAVGPSPLGCQKKPQSVQGGPLIQQSVQGGALKQQQAPALQRSPLRPELRPLWGRARHSHRTSPTVCGPYLHTQRAQRFEHSKRMVKRGKPGASCAHTPPGVQRQAWVCSLCSRTTCTSSGGSAEALRAWASASCFWNSPDARAEERSSEPPILLPPTNTWQVGAWAYGTKGTSAVPPHGPTSGGACD